tara:strand:+ start:1081 stop:1347 length:267 start_codon:yes stop_codon:yes gene_type:complete
MTYDWEKIVKAKIGEMQDLLPDEYQIVAVAVEAVGDGEGALVEANALSLENMDVTEADIRQDILSDAKRQYDAVYESVFTPTAKGRVQ